MTIPKTQMKWIATLFLAVGLVLGGQTVAATKIACVGDSITFGAGIKDRATKSYPAQLQALLGDDYEVRNFGVSGATLLKNGNKPYWKLPQFQAAQDFQPDIVIIKLGTNDSKPGNWKHREEFRDDYVEMVELFQDLASKPDVYVCLPVPVFATRWGINEETVKGEVIPLVKKVARKTRAEMIDLYAPLEGKPELLPDKIHPNADGAEVMAKTIQAAIRK